MMTLNNISHDDDQNDKEHRAENAEFIKDYYNKNKKIESEQE